MMTHAAKGNSNISWLHCHLTEMKNRGMFEGFSAVLGSSETGFPGAGIVAAAVPDKPILGTMARPQAKPSCELAAPGRSTFLG